MLVIFAQEAAECFGFLRAEVLQVLRCALFQPGLLDTVAAPVSEGDYDLESDQIGVTNQDTRSTSRPVWFVVSSQRRRIGLSTSCARIAVPKSMQMINSNTGIQDPAAW